MQIKAFLVDSLALMKSHSDDQIATIMYHVTKPHLLQMDRYHEIFLCTYKENVDAFAIANDDCSLLYNGKRYPVALLHLNSGMYAQLATR